MDADAIAAFGATALTPEDGENTPLAFEDVRMATAWLHPVDTAPRTQLGLDSANNSADAPMPALISVAYAHAFPLVGEHGTGMLYAHDGDDDAARAAIAIVTALTGGIDTAFGNEVVQAFRGPAGNFDTDGSNDGADLENVHEHSVAATTRRNLSALRSRVTDQSCATTSETRESVIAHVLGCEGVSDAVKAAAFEVVDALTDDHNAAAGASQLDALQIVWATMELITDDAVRDGARDTLVHQLASALEGGFMVCPTGVIVRIVGTLDGVDDASLSQVHRATTPFWVVRAELADLAARVRDEMACDDNETDGDAAARAAFVERARHQYVTQLGFSESVMRPVIEEFAEHI